MQKSVHSVQGFEIGPRARKSLAIVIPASVVRELGITTSSIMALTVESNTNRICLEILNVAGAQRIESIPVES
jgi:antitoxin component of MazEF toxin-antitoxin module